jgi:hypothetical protein
MQDRFVVEPSCAKLSGAGIGRITVESIIQSFNPLLPIVRITV